LTYQQHFARSQINVDKVTQQELVDFGMPGFQPKRKALLRFHNYLAEHNPPLTANQLPDYPGDSAMLRDLGFAPGYLVDVKNAYLATKDSNKSDWRYRILSRLGKIPY
jgi:hypothetical protein